MRSLLSYVRISVKAEAAGTDTTFSDRQALTALRALATALDGIDIDCVTLIDRYAKANRRAKETRRAA